MHVLSVKDHWATFCKTIACGEDVTRNPNNIHLAFFCQKLAVATEIF